MAYGTVNADVIGTSVAGSNIGAGNASIMKNRIINGAMVIDQRNAGASVTASTTGAWTYFLDRWSYIAAVASKFTIQQNAGSVTPPVGFSNYLGVTSSAATTVGSGDYYIIKQAIEGFNTADLQFGTANAKTVTLSFWVRSSLTGTFGGSLINSATNRSYPYSYTISSANTWEQKSITIAGDTSGTWVGSTNGIGIQVCFGLGVGSTLSGTAGAWAGAEYYSVTGATNVVSTSGATFYITGVQLEVGSSATGFEYVNYQTSLANCQRYYFQYLMRYGVAGFNENTGGFLGVLAFPSMRSAPTISTSGATYQIRIAGSVVNCSSVTGDSTTQNTCRIVGNASGLTAGQGSLLIASSDTYLGLSAEL
jgi:hypothetical protein